MPTDPPNVLQIVTDQQQARALGAVDSTYETPNLDRLADSGTRFSGAYCTHAQCTPSRSSFLTGQYPHQTGSYTLPYWGGYPLDPDRNESVGRIMDEAGYDVSWTGKWHLGGDNMAALGFDPLPPADDELPEADIDDRGDMDGVTTARAIQYLSEYEGDDPFFLTASYRLPHPPYYEESAVADRVSRDAVPIPESFSEDPGDKPAYVRERRETLELDEEYVRDIGYEYRTMVAQVDEYVGRLLDALDARGLRDETAVVFHSDHGDMLGAHGIDKKGCLAYEEIYRVPIIVETPGVEAEREVVDDLLTNAAVPGTILEIAGESVPASFEGGSLLPALRRTERPTDERVFFEHKFAHWGEFPFRGVRTRRWKYVEHLGDCEDGELYDLRSDPHETENLAADPDPEHEEVIAGLRTDVHQWWAESNGDLDDWVNSPVPDPEDT